MMRSLQSGVSGLRSHQIRMDVIANNVANVNTLAFKSGRVNFKEGFAQVLRSATAPGLSAGGSNPLQVGLGVQTGSIDTRFTQGVIEDTGIKTDLAIQGDSFFVVGRGDTRSYTRAGNFQMDASGRLTVPGTGYLVQGRMATDGVLSDRVTDLRIPFDQKSPASVTGTVGLVGNLDASAPVDPDTVVQSTSMTVYDSLGNKHELMLDFTKTGDNEWRWEVDAGGLPEDAVVDPGSGTFVFEDGLLVADASDFQIGVSNLPGGAGDLDITLNTGSGLDGLSQFASAGTAVMRDQDGYPLGELEDFNIDATGTLRGSFSNGEQMVLGQVTLADFTNPEGLTRAGDNLYEASANSGDPVLGYALESTDSAIIGGALEMSNVDLAAEFTSMITAQRGFQANGRSITTADEMLQEVVNLKR